MLHTVAFPGPYFSPAGHRPFVTPQGIEVGDNIHF